MTSWDASLPTERGEGVVFSTDNAADPLRPAHAIPFHRMLFRRLQADPRLARRLAVAALTWPLCCLLAGAVIWFLSDLGLGDARLSFASRVARSRQVVTVAALLLTFLALAGTAWAARSAWRRHERDRRGDAYRIASDAAHDGLCIVRTVDTGVAGASDFIIEDCNERAAGMLGGNLSALRGLPLSQIEGGSNAHVNLALLRSRDAAPSDAVVEDEYRVSKFGQLHATWMHRRVARCLDGYAITLRDISASRAHERALSRMANADALTTLPNRLWLSAFLPDALARAQVGGTVTALLVIGLDNFKNVNDTQGHGTGDLVLQAVAFRLRAAIRSNDPVIRLGGDEFTVVLEQIQSAAEAAAVAENLISALAQPFVLSGGAAQAINASIGISLFPRDADAGETLLKHADLAMHVAKEQGKAQYLFYEPALTASLHSRIDREQALRQAIEQDQFVVYFQPRVNARTGVLCSMEALVRWQHPQRGMVPPIEFIALAESTGLIVQLGALVIEKTCVQLGAWKAAGVPVVPVSINVSSRQFAASDLRVLFADAMRRHDLAPQLLEIELTESCMIGDDEAVFPELRALQAAGIKLLVDDFGTGYSSLSQLQRMNFDVLKVDMAFTSALGNSTEGEVFFKAIIWMAHALGMTVVAEGVESLVQLRILQALDCDEIQGFLVSRPVAAQHMTALLQRRSLFDEHMLPVLDAANTA